MGQRARRWKNDSDHMAELLHEWGGWRRCSGKGVGWGGGIDRDPIERILSGSKRDPNTHGDPVFAEYVGTTVDGQGLMRFVDARIREHRPLVVDLLRGRYEFLRIWEEIGRALNITEGHCHELHRQVCGRLEHEAKRYVQGAKWDRDAETLIRLIA